MTESGRVLSSVPRVPLPRLLCIDDESQILEGLRRLLRDRFDVAVAVGGRAGIDRLRSEEAFAVVMTDMRMPDVDGVAVLRAARELRPETTRVLLTGQADLSSAVAAVNDGYVFRFLLKPCPRDQLRAALDDAVEQHRLLRVERELLSGTLKGAIKLCLDILALVHPEALSRGARVRRVASMLATKVDGVEEWTVEVAALLSDLGAITLPSAVLTKLHAGAMLTLGERQQIDRLPVVAANLVAAIPRLEPVRDILRFQRTHYDGSHSPERGIAGARIPVGARILHLANDYDALESRDVSLNARFRALRASGGRYDPVLLTMLRDLVEEAAAPTSAASAAGSLMRLGSASVGLIFAEDIVAPNGIVLIGRGQEVTAPLLDRIGLFPGSVRERLVRVLPPASAPAVSAPAVSAPAG
ncbi:HD domain-containing phosphohydrolase [Gemmatimonas sp.]|uniref:HD domain-containing phosphohydrolase n=1 Tax=Gemmatimonas sp. TaxID=1962908 RepID=UPI00286D1041|nr:HD domain-containing phosphohydrolase [Gemmatimonas sp.]